MDENEIPLELTPELIAGLKVIFGLDALETEMQDLRAENIGLKKAMEQMLAYINVVDLRVQQFNGDKTVTRKFTPELNTKTGSLSLSSFMPDLPLDLESPSKGMEEKVITMRRPKRQVTKVK